MFHIEYDLRQGKHLTDTPLHFSIRKKEVNAMTCDEALYRQYLNGDDAGLEVLMKKYGDPLTLYIDGYLHDVHEAEELMLDVFAYLFTKKPRIRDGGFKAYLYKAARNMALRHKSKRKPLFSLDALTGEPDGRLLVEEVIRTEERNRVLHFCMSEMNPDYREVLYLTYFEDMSYAQAAEVTGKTVKQITNMVYRGKESLRRLLERRGSQMRSHEERVAETKRRIAKIEQEKRRRRNTITMASAVAACLVLLIGASLAMPGIAASIQTGDYSGFETAASIFHGGAALGYIVIGLLAFLLGVCVTVLCFRLRQMSREDDQNKESEGIHGAD